MASGDFFGVLAQYPATTGMVHDLRPLAGHAHQCDAAFCVAADLLALTLLVPPGEWDADIVCGTTQRFGMPMGATAARMPPTWPAATSSSARCPAGWSA